jgi:hypothetical protein
MDLADEEQGVPITVAVGRRVRWARTWRELRRVA